MKFKQIEISDSYIYGLDMEGGIYVARLNNDHLISDWKQLQFKNVVVDPELIDSVVQENSDDFI